MSIALADLYLPNQVASDLRTLAIQGMPEEVCGVVFTHGTILQLPNTFCGDKRHGFDMEIEMSRTAHIKAIWHSHPTGPDFPSEQDKPSMNRLMEYGFDFPWIIVTPKHITTWRAIFD